MQSDFFYKEEEEMKSAVNRLTTLKKVLNRFAWLMKLKYF